MITSQDRLQPMDERRLTHQGARHSTVDHGYPSDDVFLLLHLWVLPSRWLISLRRSPSSLSSLWMASWCEWLSPNGMRDSTLLHQGYVPWSWDFLGEFLVGVFRHSVRELHPPRCPVWKPNMWRAKSSKSTFATSLYSRRVSFFSSRVIMTNLSEYRGAYGGGVDDRVEWRGRTGGSSICPWGLMNLINEFVWPSCHREECGSSSVVPCPPQYSDDTRKPSTSSNRLSMMA
jgi:hypothetical protein